MWRKTDKNLDTFVCRYEGVDFNTTLSSKEYFEKMKSRLDRKKPVNSEYGVAQKDFVYKKYQQDKANGKHGCILALKNGSVFADNDLVVIGKDKRVRKFMVLYVYVTDNKVYDKVNGWSGTNMYEYFGKLSESNPRLRVDSWLAKGSSWDAKSSELFKKLAERR